MYFKRRNKLFLTGLLVCGALGLLLTGLRPTIASVEADSSRLKKALESFQLEPGLSISLVAAEPLVIDPVAFAFDEQHRLYVVEDRGYPDPVDGSEAPAVGRIALLQDTDGDGSYDKRSEFVTDLTYPNGILPWKGGVFVTCAPHVYYFKDTDGDGVADIRDTVLTGFNANQTAQIRVSHPTLGLDGWVYLTSGLNSGKIRSPRYPDRPEVAFTSADGRFHPETLEFQSTGGRSQFGLAFDPFGRRFGTSNRHPVMQMLLEPWQLKRNPSLLFSETHRNISDVEADARVFPVSGAVTTAEFIPKLIGLSHTGTFTSACGLLVFNGGGLTPAHQGNVFICEPAQNLVQRQTLRPDGVSFRSDRVSDSSEFLASTDEWFRPVFLQHGPDGALYLADMYRKVIDHPSYVPEEARHLLDFESGKQDGRIYRIASASADRSSKLPAPGKQLPDALASGNEWTRETAFRLMLQDKDKELSASLRQVLMTASSPEGRARALWLLFHFGTLGAQDLERAAADQSAGVREQAVKIAELQLSAGGALPEWLLRMDPDPRVRFVTALALGESAAPAVTEALAGIAAADGADSWSRNAVLSGIAGRLPVFLNTFRQQKKIDPVAYAGVMQDLGRLFGNAATIAECKTLLAQTLEASGGDDWRIATVLGLAEGVARRQEVKDAPLVYLTAATPAAAKLEAFMKKANQRVLQTDLPLAERKNVIALLGYGRWEEVKGTLRQLLDNSHPAELQLAAIAALRQMKQPEGAAYLTDSAVWTAYTPQVKNAAMVTLVSGPEFVKVLFDALEQKVIGAAEITSNDRQRLMKHKDPEISKKAAAYFDELESGGRMNVYKSLLPRLQEPADANRGKEVFERSCSACHTLAGAPGGNVGPDLTGVRNQPAEALLLHIIVPNYEVYPSYQTVTLETHDGRTLSGWLVAETEHSITLKTAFSTEEAVLRKHIKTLSNPGVSLMPDGLEQTMTEQELLDLILYIKKTR